MTPPPTKAFPKQRCPGHQRSMRGPMHSRYCPACARTVVAPFVFGATVLRVAQLVMLICAAGLLVSIGLRGAADTAGAITPGSFAVLLPIGLVSTIASLLLAFRLILLVTRRYWGRRAMGYWYDRLDLARDVLLIAAGAMLISVSMLLLGGLFDFLALRSHGGGAWWIPRIIVLSVLTMLLFLLATRWELVAPAGLFPRYWGVWAGSAYGLLVPLVFLLFHQGSAAVTGPVITLDSALAAGVPVPLFCASVAIQVAARLQQRWMARRREIVLNDERCPAVLKTANLEAYVAVAGPPQCGKSTFLACAHRLMEKTGALEGEVRLSAGPPRRGLAWLLENIYHRRILRSGTLEVEMNTLQVELQGTARISLSWLDIPGDLVINPTSQPVESQEAYADHLANADVLVLMIKAEDLLANRDIQTNQHLQALADTAYRFQEGLARQTGPVRQVPLLLVITQMCRLSTDGQRAEIEREAQTYFRHVIQTWQRGCRRTNNQAVIRIFCTSAVVTKLEDGHRIRHDAWHLEHEQVLQAIYWLTAQVTRVHMEQLTFVQKPRIQGELRRQVLWLEEESDGRVPGTTPLPPWDPRREHRTLSGL